MLHPCSRSLFVLLSFCLGLAAASGARSQEPLWGEDVLVGETQGFGDLAFDIASNGDIYVAVDDVGPLGDEIRVYRSQDGGVTWELWSTVGAVSGSTVFEDVDLLVAEGTEDRVYLAYNYRFVSGGLTLANFVYVSYGELGGAGGITNTSAVIEGLLNQDLTGIQLATDAANHLDYSVFVAAVDVDDTGNRIWFARSDDFGGTWDPDYLLADGSSEALVYTGLRLACGLGGRVHLVCSEKASGGTNQDSAILYRRAANRAANGITDWSGWTAFTSIGDGFRDMWPDVAASPADNDVVVSYYREDDDDYLPRYLVVRSSGDGGATWPAANVTEFDAPVEIPRVEWTSAGWVLAAFDLGAGHVWTAGFPEPLSWTGPEIFTADGGSELALAADPSRSDRPAVAWIDYGENPNAVLFDAAWLADPGYPNLQASYPLSSAPSSSPALVDIDGGLDLEILFGDTAGRIQLRRASGISLGGWPVQTEGLPDGIPVAAGHVLTSAYRHVAAGTVGGTVHLRKPLGDSERGWPVDLGTGAPAHVAIGVITGESAGEVVAVSGSLLAVLDPWGDPRPGFPVVTAGGIGYPPAIGDLDDDGQTDILVAHDSSIEIFGADGDLWLVREFPGESISDAPTLGDLDLDQDLEILVPMASGKVFVLHHTGEDYPGGWPFVAPISSPATSVAVGNNLGLSNPELAFAIRLGAVHLMTHDGAVPAGWPHPRAAGETFASPPIIERTDGGSSDVVIATTDGLGHSWNNLFAAVPGWPKFLGLNPAHSPASGDLDADGRLEVVFLTQTDLVVLDVGEYAWTSESSRWPMDGHDPERTGCADCWRPVVVGTEGELQVPEEPGFAVVRNPVRGSAEFAYRLESPTAVRLEVFDPAGRRVRTVLREEQPAGAYRRGWDGMDDAGHEAAAGVYFVRLVTGSEARVLRLVLLR